MLNAIVAAILMAMNVRSSTPDTCLKLRPPSQSLAVDLGLIRRHVVWNGAKITRHQFERYLKEQLLKGSNAIFLVHWDSTGMRAIDKITDEIRQRGFEVAMNCPPVPF